MDPNAASLIALGLILLVSVTVALLGARMVRRDSAAAVALPTVRAELAAMSKTIQANDETASNQRTADFETLKALIESAQATASDALDVAVTARKRVTKKRGPQAAAEKAAAVDEFVVGAPADFGEIAEVEFA